MKKRKGWKITFYDNTTITITDTEYLWLQKEPWYKEGNAKFYTQRVIIFSK